jgi:adenine phosphoribosyltransferase
MKLEDKIRDGPDFPKEGIIFKDITTLLKDASAFKQAIDELAAQYQDKWVDVVVAMESRGFIFAAPLAYKLGIGFVPARKPGKLPAETVSAQYSLEYGVDAIEMHKDAIVPGQRVLIVDDLLATGGTAAATVELVEKLGGEVVGVAFLIELTFLNGRQRLTDYPISSLIQC